MAKAPNPLVAVCPTVTRGGVAPPEDVGVGTLPWAVAPVPVAPPVTVEPDGLVLPKFNADWILRTKSELATTIRASMETCFAGVSSLAMTDSTSTRREGTSVRMMELFRVSGIALPRLLNTDLP